MSNLGNILNKLEVSANDPFAQIDEAKKNNKKVIGCIPYFAPLELVHAAGMQPIELWGGGVRISEAGSYYPAFYCSILFTLMENALE